MIKLKKVDHFVVGCSVLKASEYKLKHDRIGLYQLWIMCKYYNVHYVRNWCEYRPETVTEIKNITILQYTVKEA